MTDGSHSASKPPLRSLPKPTGRARTPIVAPRPGERMSESSKEALAELALDLLEEQVQARIVHYKAELDTNPELDAITAQVVAQVREMQSNLEGQSERAQVDRDRIADSQEAVLIKLLRRLFPQQAPSLTIEKRTKGIVRQLARLFFQSELHEKTRGQDGSTKVIQHGEQALFYLLVRYRHRMENELGGFDFADDEVRERSFDLLRKLTKDMQDSFLSRRSSALKRLVGVFNEVLFEFYVQRIPPALETLAHEVIHQAKTFEGRAYPYKVTSDSFPRFRTAFERRLMVRLVGAVEDQLVSQLADTAGAARDETVKFITDPKVFSMICGELCDASYEFLCNEGFLDLPENWRGTI